MSAILPSYATPTPSTAVSLQSPTTHNNAQSAQYPYQQQNLNPQSAQYSYQQQNFRNFEPRHMPFPPPTTPSSFLFPSPSSTISVQESAAVLSLWKLWPHPARVFGKRHRPSPNKQQPGEYRAGPVVDQQELNVPQCSNNVQDTCCLSTEVDAQVHTVHSPLLSNYVQFQIQAVNFFALVDSGAGISCINSQLLTKNNVFKNFHIQDSDRKYIVSATGERTSIEGMMYVKDTINKTHVKCKFYIVPNEPSIILGRDFLCDYNVQMQFSEGGVSISIDPRRSVVSQSTVTIPFKSQAVLIARTKGAPLPQEVVRVTSGCANLFSLGLLQTKSLSRNMHGKIQYGCANFTDEPVVIGKGTALGKFTCLSRHHELYEKPTECDISGGPEKCTTTTRSKLHVHDTEPRYDQTICVDTSTSTSIQILGRIHMSGRLAKVENLAHVRCNVQCAQVLIYRMSIIVRVKIQSI